MNSALQKIAKAVWPLLLAAVLWSVAPLRLSIWIDLDEGFNGMKALLFMRGHAFYSEIWSDQPPLWYVFLAGWFRVAGVSLESARVLALLFSSLLVVAFCRTVQTRSGMMVAVMAGALLVGADRFLVLSRALMETVPALALAMLGLWIVTRPARRSSWLRSVAAGVLMGLALQVKFNMAMLLPILAGVLLQNGHRDEGCWNRRAAQPAGLFLLAAATVFMAVAVFFREDPQQLFLSHWRARGNPLIVNMSGWEQLPEWIAIDYLLWIAALFGIVMGWQIRRRDIILPLTWLAVVVLVLIPHKPVWWHYKVMFQLPLAWLAAIGLDSFVNRHYEAAPGRILLRPLQLGVLALVLGVLLPARWLRAHDRCRPTHYPLSAKVLNSMRPFAERTRWVVVDDVQVYPFQLNLPVPPELAVTSYKRKDLGELSDERMVEIVRRYDPEQMLFMNSYPFGPGLLDLAEQKYVSRAPQPMYIHLVRRNLVEGDAAGGGWSADLCGTLAAALWQNSAVPQAVPALHRMARSLVSRGRAEEAIRLARSACDMTQYRNTEYMETLAAAYEAAGQAEKAAQVRAGLGPGGKGAP